MQSPKRRERMWKSQRVRERKVFSMTSIMRERERERWKESESFDWILLNSKLIGVIGTVSTYLAIWEKRVNCGNTFVEIRVGEKVCENAWNVV